MYLLKRIKSKYFTAKISKPELNDFLLVVLKEKQDMIDELKVMIEKMAEFDLTVEEYLELELKEKNGVINV